MKTERKIKVLQGIRRGKSSAGESYLLSLVEGLDKDRFAPAVLSFTEGPIVDRLKERGVPVYVIPTEKPFDLKVWSQVAALIETEEIDIVHAHGSRAMSNLFRAARQTGRPLIYTCHGWSFHPDQNPLVRRMRILSEKYLTRKADLNICGGTANRNLARKLFGRFEAEVIHNAIDHDRFNPYAKYKDVRTELGIGEDEIVIACVARFTWQRQPLKMIAAFAEVAAAVPTATLLMVGDGEDKQQAVELVSELGLQTRVIIQPFRNDVPAVLAGADVFALPSLWEGFPLALLQAMSMGKAVIVTSVDGNPEMVQDGFNGLLIGTENLQEDLAQGLIRLCEDDVLRRMLSANAIASVYGKFDARVMVQKNEALYRRIMKLETGSRNAEEGRKGSEGNVLMAKL